MEVIHARCAGMDVSKKDAKVLRATRRCWAPQDGGDGYDVEFDDQPDITRPRRDTATLVTANN